MGKIEITREQVMKGLVVAGPLINLIILATGAVGGDDGGESVVIDPRTQQRTISRLNEQIAEGEAKFRSCLSPRKDTVKELIALAQNHGVSIEKVDNSGAQQEEISRTTFNKLATNVEISGPQDSVISMLVDLGITTTVNSVAVSRSPDQWSAKFILTQYLRTS